tara:strand:+ start:753 stop:920 length:168 start_codon:yes stop_codon:yes gene_type:complete
MYFPQVVAPTVRPQMLSEELQAPFNINGTGVKSDARYRKPINLIHIDKNKTVKTK